MRALERVLETDNHNVSNSSSIDKKDDTLRLKRLQDFQIQVIAKAMSFPAAEAIVYSTCSVHRVRLNPLSVYLYLFLPFGFNRFCSNMTTLFCQEENEDVVRQILEGFPDWDVQLPSCLASWHRRGLPTPVSPLLFPIYCCNLLLLL